jgi:hypothetical protein
LVDDLEPTGGSPSLELTANPQVICPQHTVARQAPYVAHRASICAQALRSHRYDRARTASTIFSQGHTLAIFQQ